MMGLIGRREGSKEGRPLGWLFLGLFICFSSTLSSVEHLSGRLESWWAVGLLGWWPVSLEGCRDGF